MVKSLLKNLWAGQEGQDLIEYTLLITFIALACVGLFITPGLTVSQIWSTGNTELSAAVSAAS